MNIKTRLTSWVSIALAVLLWTTDARGEQAFSPRGYCQATGGAVLESGNADIYICCYATRQRCLAVNTLSRTSVQVNFPDDCSDALPETKGNGATESGKLRQNKRPCIPALGVHVQE